LITCPVLERIPLDLVLHHGKGGGGGLVPRLFKRKGKKRKKDGVKIKVLGKKKKKL